MTARLLVRYRRPVPIKADLALTADVGAERGRRTDVAGTLQGPEGEILAEATGTYMHVPLEHFLATPEGRAAGEAWRERLGG